MQCRRMDQSFYPKSNLKTTATHRESISKLKTETGWLVDAGDPTKEKVLEFC